VTTPPDDLLAEVAEVALRYGWSLDAVLDLEHRDRRRFLAQARALAAGDATPGGAAAGTGGAAALYAFTPQELLAHA
jgi:hypothetical protein